MAFAGFIGCNYSNDNFKIKINHQSKTSKSNMSFYVSQKKIKVEINEKKFPFGKKSTSFERNIYEDEADRILSFVESLNIDTIKNASQKEIEPDGIVSTIEIKLPKKARKTIELNNISNKTCDTLFQYIDNLIADRKFRFGQQN